MKNKIMIAIFISIFLMCSASSVLAFQLNDWQVDLTGFTGGSKVTGIDGLQLQNVVNSTTIVQNLGGNGAIDSGDTFTESGQMFAGDYYDNATTLNFHTASGYYLNADFGSLTGAVDSILAPDRSIYTYHLAGQIAWYIDDDSDAETQSGNVDATPGTLVANATIILNGINTATNFPNNNIQGTSAWNVTVQFDNMMAGIFFAGDGVTDLKTYVDKGWLQASVSGITTIPAGGVTPLDADNIQFIGTTGDSAYLNVVPEPSTLVLFGLGLLGLAGFGRKKFFNKQ